MTNLFHSRLRPALIILAMMALAALVSTGCGRQEQEKKPAPPKPSAQAQPGLPAPAVTPQAQPVLIVQSGPVVAIIIDDLGMDMAHLDMVLPLGKGLTFAVMPGLPCSARTAGRARQEGHEVIMHLPMQPKGEVKGLGPGALLTGMSADDLHKTFLADYATVPGADGVNNHMGSLLTEDRAAMNALMGVLKEKGLIFIDSRTTASSVALQAAKDAGVRAAERAVFLDDSAEPDDINAQFDRMVSLAQKRGAVVAIGHPRPNTVGVLMERLPELEKSGIKLVRVSELAR
ncbi:MAG TPA: divergent polysaccharide deacetylase family protein [Nitrospirota bacterium]|jgi:hypothetical protein